MLQSEVMWMFQFMPNYALYDIAHDVWFDGKYVLDTLQGNLGLTVHDAF